MKTAYHRTGSLLFLFILFLATPTLAAHPHIWIDSSIQPGFNADGLAQIEVEWTFDEFYSATILLDADQNKDKNLSSGEIQWLFDNMFRHLNQRGYFLYIFVDTRRIPVADAKDFTAEVRRGSLVFRFTLPVVIPWNDLPDLRIANLDESYYTDFLITNTEEHIKARGRTMELQTATETWDFGEWGSFPVKSLKIRMRQ